jgi:pimeloyl-ACP methyl ester carboxylesterase
VAGTDQLEANPVRAFTAGTTDLPEAVRDVFEAPPPGRASAVEAGGYSWHTLEWGEPGESPVLLVHGVTSNSETFWRVGPCVAATGRRVIAVDLPGHGRTGGWRGRHRWIETARDVAGFIHMSALDRSGLAIVGHSWGAMTAAHLPAAGFRPERLILVDPPAMTVKELVPWTQDPTEQRHEALADAVATVRASGVGWSEGDIHAKAIGLTQIDDAAVLAIYLENGDWDAGLAALSDPAAREIPIWIIRGDPAQGGLIADEHVPALAARVGQDHFITIAGASHSPQRTHPEALILAILEALA